MTDARFPLLLVLLAFAVPASAQIYRWVDSQGRVNFSNSAPPQGVKATVVDPNAKEAPPSVESTECYTIRCQGERMEERERKREAELAKLSAERAAVDAKRPRGLEFRKYLSIQRGMSEGELLGIAGEPDLKADHGVAIAAPTTVQIGRHVSGAARTGLIMVTYTYMPTPGDPFTTTITLIGGRVDDVERVRKF
jgi:hypothetical protein